MRWEGTESRGAGCYCLQVSGASPISVLHPSPARKAGLSPLLLLQTLASARPQAGSSTSIPLWEGAALCQQGHHPRVHGAAWGAMLVERRVHATGLAALSPL